MASEERQQQFYPINGGVFRACAGKFAHIPSVNSKVCYFPQGHAEQASHPMTLPPEIAAAKVRCVVTDLSYFSDANTHEVFVKFNLQPSKSSIDMNQFGLNEGKLVQYDNPGFVSYYKVLTSSDSNNGGGFSVPRNCAVTVFPTLDYSKPVPPAQKLDISDGHGQSWKFSHVYRGSPLRHLLTSNWSNFVDHMLLITGDTVVFVRDIETGKMFVGIRRFYNFEPDWELIKFLEEQKDAPVRAEFWRFNRGRVDPSAVMEAAEKALKGEPFEAVYYPRFDMAEFVVDANKTVSPIQESPSVRVKIPIDSNEETKKLWYFGWAVSGDSVWRRLEVEWDDIKDVKELEKFKRVNPWQVEVVASASSTVEKGKVGSRVGLLNATSNNNSCFVNCGGIQGPRHMYNSSCTNPPAQSHPSLSFRLMGFDIQVQPPPNESTLKNNNNEDDEDNYNGNNIKGNNINGNNNGKNNGKNNNNNDDNGTELGDHDHIKRPKV